MKTIVGVTGGSGSGKTQFCRFLAELGAKVIDADVVARQVVQKGQPALTELTEAFGRGILRTDGSLNRKELARLTFPEPERLHILNQITHKYIIEEIRHELDDITEGIAVIDAALLIESGLSGLCAATVCVLAPKKVRLARIMARDGLKEAEAEARLAAQPQDSFYITHTDSTVYNDGDMDALYQKAQEFYRGFIKGV